MSKFKIGEKVMVIPWEEAIKTEFNMTSYYVCDIEWDMWEKYFKNKIITITSIKEQNKDSYSRIQDYLTDTGYLLPEELLIKIDKEELLIEVKMNFNDIKQAVKKYLLDNNLNYEIEYESDTHTGFKIPKDNDFISIWIKYYIENELVDNELFIDITFVDNDISWTIEEPFKDSNIINRVIKLLDFVFNK
jgi:hypothetical protein